MTTPESQSNQKTYEHLLVERHEGGVGLIQLNRPKVLNALNGALMAELVAALQAFDQDSAVGCIVITGSEKAFAAGADIKEMATLSAVEMFQRDTIALWDGLAAIHKPIIAAVAGYCLGGGCELAMACDLTIAAATAKFGQPEINLGVIPGAGGTQRLTRAVGRPLAMDMILTGRQITADEALRAGLVSRVVPPETYLAEALDLARTIASKAPIAVRLAKEAVHKAEELPLAEGLAYERRSFYFLFATEDQQEGMVAFLNKRAPQWKGR
jgi:enoyl-CoA hydratase